MYTKITRENSMDIAKQYIRAFSGSAWDVSDVENRILEYINISFDEFVLEIDGYVKKLAYYFYVSLSEFFS